MFIFFAIFGRGKIIARHTRCLLTDVRDHWCKTSHPHICLANAVILPCDQCACNDLALHCNGVKHTNTAEICTTDAQRHYGYYMASLFAVASLANSHPQLLAAFHMNVRYFVPASNCCLMFRRFSFMCEFVWDLRIDTLIVFLKEFLKKKLKKGQQMKVKTH